MALTGLPLIAVCGLLALATGAATVLLWSRFGRWRLVSRTVGLVVCEVLAVLAVGLVANRHEQFYPSWQALEGDTGTATRTAVQAAGRLDGTFTGGRLQADWRPAGSAGWHLAGTARVTVPGDYPGGHDSYPALLTLGGQPSPASLVQVTVDPGKQTTASSLADLPARLAADLRVTGHGWALVTSSAAAPLAVQLIRADPGRFATLAVVGGLPQGVRPPAGVAVAVSSAPAKTARPAKTAKTAEPAKAAKPARTAKPVAKSKHPTARPVRLRIHRTRPHRFTPTVLTGSWSAATAWAVAQTPLPLAAPEVLPKGAAR
jgi:lysyl-tRNA synthetase class 2